MSVLGGGGGGGGGGRDGGGLSLLNEVKRKPGDSVFVVILLLLFSFFFCLGEFLLFTNSHTKKVNKPFVVLRVGGGTSKIRQVYDIKKKATSIKRPPSGYR